MPDFNQLAGVLPPGFTERRGLLQHLASERILLVGIPGAGKTTTASLLCEELEAFNFISLGDISRRLRPGSEDARLLAQLFETGQPGRLAPFFLKLVDPYLRQFRDTGFLFDGIPKTPDEVTALSNYMEASLGTRFSLVLYLQTSLEIALDRIGSRGVQDPRDSEAMYSRRIALYGPTIRELRRNFPYQGIPWITVQTDCMQPDDVIKDILKQYSRPEVQRVLPDAFERIS